MADEVLDLSGSINIQTAGATSNLASVGTAFNAVEGAAVKATSRISVQLNAIENAARQASNNVTKSLGSMIPEMRVKTPNFNPVQQAYRDLRISSDKDLQEMSKKAADSFATIVRSGAASPKEIERAYQAMRSKIDSIWGEVETKTLSSNQHIAQVSTRTAQQVAQASNNTAQSVANNLNVVGAAFSVGIIAKLGEVAHSVLSAGFAFNSMKQQSLIAFQSMLGSADAAKAKFQELQQFAAATPFNLEGLLNATKQLQAFGFKAESIMPILKGVGDAAAALGGGPELIGRMILQLGQMHSTGKAAYADLKVLALTGIPVFKILADAMGLSEKAVLELAHKGIIPADQAIVHLVQGIEKLPQFADAMLKQANTFQGVMSTIQDVISQVTGKLTEELFNKVSAGLSLFADKLSQFGDLVDKMGVVGAISAMTGLSEAFIKGAAAFTAVLIVAAPLSLAITALGSLFAALVSPVGLVILAIGALAAVIIANVGGIQEKLASAGRNIYEFFQKSSQTFNELGAVVKLAFNVILGIITVAVSEIGNIIKIGAALLNGNWKEVWEGLGDIVKTRMDFIAHSVIPFAFAVVRASTLIGLALIKGLWQAGAEAWVETVRPALLSINLMIGQFFLDLPVLIVKSMLGIGQLITDNLHLAPYVSFALGEMVGVVIRYSKDFFNAFMFLINLPLVAIREGWTLIHNLFVAGLNLTVVSVYSGFQNVQAAGLSGVTGFILKVAAALPMLPAYFVQAMYEVLRKIAEWSIKLTQAGLLASGGFIMGVKSGLKGASGQGSLSDALTSGIASGDTGGGSKTDTMAASIARIMKQYNEQIAKLANMMQTTSKTGGKIAGAKGAAGLSQGLKEGLEEGFVGIEPAFALLRSRLETQGTKIFEPMIGKVTKDGQLLKVAIKTVIDNINEYLSSQAINSKVTNKVLEDLGKTGVENLMKLTEGYVKLKEAENAAGIEMAASLKAPLSDVNALLKAQGSTVELSAKTWRVMTNAQKDAIVAISLIIASLTSSKQALRDSADEIIEYGEAWMSFRRNSKLAMEQYRNHTITFDQLSDVLNGRAVQTAKVVDAMTDGILKDFTELKAGTKALKTEMIKDVNILGDAIRENFEAIDRAISKSVGVVMAKAVLEARSKVQELIGTFESFGTEVLGLKDAELLDYIKVNTQQTIEEILNNLNTQLPTMTEAARAQVAKISVELQNQANRMLADYASKLYELPGIFDTIFNTILKSLGKWNAESIKNVKGWAKDIFAIINEMPGKFGDAARGVLATVEHWISFFDKVLALAHRFSKSIPESVGKAIEAIIEKITGKKVQTATQTAAATFDKSAEKMANAADRITEAVDRLTKTIDKDFNLIDDRVRKTTDEFERMQDVIHDSANGSIAAFAGMTNGISLQSNTLISSISSMVNSLNGAFSSIKTDSVGLQSSVGGIFGGLADLIKFNTQPAADAAHSAGKNITDNLLSGLSGGARIVPTQSRSKVQGAVQGGLGGAAAGAGIGATIGTFVGSPALGAAIGAGIGAIVGAIGGIFGAAKSEFEKQLEAAQLEQAKLTTDTMKENLKQEILKTTQEAIDVMASVQTLLEKLDDFTPTNKHILQSFFKNMTQLFNMFGEFADTIGPVITKNVAKMAERMKPIIDVVSVALDVFDKMIFFIPPAESAVIAFVLAFTLLINTFILQIEDVALNATKRASKIAAKMQEVVSLLGNGVEFFAKLQDFVAAPKTAVQALVTAILEAVNLFIPLTAEIDNAGVKRAALLAQRISVVVSLLAASVEPFLKVKDFKDVPKQQIQLLIDSIKLAINLLNDALIELDLGATSQTSAKANAAQGALGLLNAAIDPFLKIDDVKQIPAEKIGILVSSIKTAVNLLLVGLADIATDTIKMLSDKANPASIIVQALGSIATALKSVAETPVFDYNAINATVEAAKRAVLAFIAEMSGLDTAAITAASEMAGGMRGIFDALQQVQTLLDAVGKSTASNQDLINLVDGWKLLVAQVQRVADSIPPEILLHIIEFSTQIKAVVDVLALTLQVFNALTDFAGLPSTALDAVAKSFDVGIKILETMLEKALKMRGISDEIREAMVATSRAIQESAQAMSAIESESSMIHSTTQSTPDSHLKSTGREFTDSSTTYHFHGDIQVQTIFDEVQTLKDVGKAIARNKNLGVNKGRIGSGR